MIFLVVHSFFCRCTPEPPPPPPPPPAPAAKDPTHTKADKDESASDSDSDSTDSDSDEDDVLIKQLDTALADKKVKPLRRAIEALEAAKPNSARCVWIKVKMLDGEKKGQVRAARC